MSLAILMLGPADRGALLPIALMPEAHQLRGISGGRGNEVAGWGIGSIHGTQS